MWRSLVGKPKEEEKCITMRGSTDHIIIIIIITIMNCGPPHIIITIYLKSKS